MDLVLHVLTTFIFLTYHLLFHQLVSLDIIYAAVQDIYFYCPGSVIMLLIHLFNVSHPKRHILENLQQFSQLS